MGCRVKCGAPAKSDAGGDPACWSEGFSPKVCCSLVHGPRGNLACWDGAFTYKRCCGAPLTEALPSSPSANRSHKGELTPRAEYGTAKSLESIWKLPGGVPFSPMPSEYVQYVGATLAALSALAACLHHARAWWRDRVERCNDGLMSDVDV